MTKQIFPNFPKSFLDVDIFSGLGGEIVTFIAFDNQENAYYSSRFKSPAGIDCDTMRFQGLGAILLWLAHLGSISHDKPRHCAAHQIFDSYQLV